LFVQKSEVEKQKAYEDVKKLASKYNGVIKRSYLCVLYLATKLSTQNTISNGGRP